MGIATLIDITLPTASASGQTIGSSQCTDRLGPNECTKFIVPNSPEANINFDVRVNNEILGKIDIKILLAGAGDRGLYGDFTAVNKNIKGLEQYLGGQEFPDFRLKWLQILTETGDNRPAGGVTFVDPPSGGFEKQWADNKPWYFDESSPNPLPPGKENRPGYLLDDNVEGSILKFFDTTRRPVNNKLNFWTFLVGDFGNNTYDFLSGFSWSAAMLEGEPFEDNNGNGLWDFGEPFTDREGNQRRSQGEPFEDKNGDGFWTPDEPFTDVSGNGYLDGTTQITELTPLKLSKELTAPFEKLVTDFGGAGSGPKRAFKLANYKFEDSLASGTELDNFSIPGVTPGAHFSAWINNDIPSNQCNPNTGLSLSSSSGYNIAYDDNSSPVGNGFGSALTGTVGSSGTLNLNVSSANGGARGQDKGNYEVFVNVYDPEESPSFSNGNSGGGGVSKEMRGLTQQNPILPNTAENGWQTFNKVPGCRWYDPYTTYGFEFQALEDTLFTEILDFPVGEDTEFAVTVGNVLLGNFGPGSSLDFVSLLGKPVSNFKITGISSLIGSTPETAFPIQLAFKEREGSFKMRAFSEDDAEAVPEPTTILAALLAAGGLGTFKRLKNRKLKQP